MKIITLQHGRLTIQISRLCELPAVQAVATIEVVGLEEIRLQLNGALIALVSLVVAVDCVEGEALGSVRFGKC